MAREYVPLTGQEPDKRPSTVDIVVAAEAIRRFERLLKKAEGPYADIARDIWRAYIDDTVCRLPREYIAMFKRVLPQYSPWMLRRGRAFIGKLLVEAGIL